MASTLTRILIHVAFSTKNREPMIPVDIESEMYAYIGGICRRMDSPLLCMNGTPDHVHMLVSLAKTETLSALMLNVKRDSSKWAHQRVPDFEWQDGYFGFSIGQSGVPALREYIENQKAHHRHVDFKDEVRMFLKKYGIEWDERYVWE
jgi:putative transposase